MNLTNKLGINPIQDGDTLMAIEYFKKKYPTIHYIMEEDRFLYRGYKFDYFKWSTSVEDGEPYTFALVDVVDRSLWFFSYREDDTFWANFLSEKAKQKIRSRWQRIVDWILNRQPVQQIQNPVI